MTRRVLYSLLLILLLPSPSMTMPCHCYSARDFDPAEPAAADPYYLATTQNSFFSIVFDMEKKDVVFAKQKPRSTAEGLWVLNGLALWTGKEAKQLKKQKKISGSWQAALQDLEVKSDRLPPKLARQLANQGTEQLMAQLIIDQLLEKKTGIATQQLEQMRQAQATNEEVILATVLWLKTAQSPSDLARMVANGKTTWGTLLLKAGMKGRDMVSEIKMLLKQAPG